LFDKHNTQKENKEFVGIGNAKYVRKSKLNKEESRYEEVCTIMKISDCSINALLYLTSYQSNKQNSNNFIWIATLWCTDNIF